MVSWEQAGSPAGEEGLLFIPAEGLAGGLSIAEEMDCGQDCCLGVLSDGPHSHCGVGITLPPQCPLHQTLCEFRSPRVPEGLGMMCVDQGHTGDAGPLTFSSRVYDSTDGGRVCVCTHCLTFPAGWSPGAQQPALPSLLPSVCVLWGLGWGACYTAPASLGRQV